MSFREIFERYLKNEATAEEIALVEDELERAQVPVSYTHLDVYKRQATSRAPRLLRST